MAVLYNYFPIQRFDLRCKLNTLTSSNTVPEHELCTKCAAKIIIIISEVASFLSQENAPFIESSDNFDHDFCLIGDEKVCSTTVFALLERTENLEYPLIFSFSRYSCRHLSVRRVFGRCSSSSLTSPFLIEIDNRISRAVAMLPCIFRYLRKLDGDTRRMSTADDAHSRERMLAWA